MTEIIHEALFGDLIFDDVLSLMTTKVVDSTSLIPRQRLVTKFLQGFNFWGCVKFNVNKSGGLHVINITREVSHELESTIVCVSR